eukprot:s53_g17.t1
MAWIGSKFLWQLCADMEHRSSVCVLSVLDDSLELPRRERLQICSQLLKCMRDSGIDVDAVQRSAVRRLQQVEQELREARRQLSKAGKGATPASESAPAPSSNRRPPSEQRGSTPKKKARTKRNENSGVSSAGTLKSLWAPKHASSSAIEVVPNSADPMEPFPDDIPEKGDDDKVINAEECLLPRSPVLQDHVPTGHSDPTIS